MTTYYLDTENGNDANDGLSFANRKKTIAAFTAALLAPGDTVRMIASRDPKSLGSGTWTDNTSSVALSSAAVAVVDDCESGWTAGAGVTITYSATNAKVGTNKMRLNLNWATVSGAQILAYKALSNLDLSTYSALSLLANPATASTLTTGTMAIRLCSDSVGAVPLVTLTLESLLVVGWHGMLLEAGGALPSGINSIAFVTLADPNTSTSGNANFDFDNIVACKGRDETGHVSHASLIGKKTVDEPEWYPIRGFSSGTTVLLGNSLATIAAPLRPYRGVTESVTTYALSPNNSRMNSVQRIIQDAGTSESARITFSGGWRRSDMSVQDGESWLSGENEYGYLVATNNLNFLAFEKIGVAAFVTAGMNLGTSSNLKIDLLGSVGLNDNTFEISASVAGLWEVLVGFAVMNGNRIFSTMGTDFRAKIRVNRITGTASTSTVGLAWADFDQSNRHACDVVVKQIDNNVHGFRPVVLGEATLKGTIFKWNDIDLYMPDGFEGRLHRPKFPLGAPVISIPSGAYPAALLLTAVNDDAWDNRSYSRGLTVLTDATTFRTTGYRSIKMSPLITTRSNTANPMKHSLLRVAAKAGVMITLEAWVMRDNTGISAGIMIEEGCIAGVTEQLSYITAAAGTWEKKSFAITPTEDGVVELLGVCHGGTTLNAWFTEAKVA